MTKKSVSEIATKMAAIDVAILSTHTSGGEIAARPMSNNGEVEYDGDSYYFTWAKSRMVADINRNSKVSLAFQGRDGFWLTIEGVGEVVRDKDEFAKHWNPDIEKWFEDGDRWCSDAEDRGDQRLLLGRPRRRGNQVLDETYRAPPSQGSLEFGAGKRSRFRK